MDPSLWTIAETEEGETTTFEDSLGDTLQERVRPLPPPDMKERGVLQGTHRLDAHTGQQRWARAGDDVVREDVCDDDRNRAVEKFSAEVAGRLGTRVDRKKDGLQTAPALETARSDLYHGFNERLRRDVRNFPDTRRGVTSLDVVGHERRAEETRAPLRVSRAAGVGSDALSHESLGVDPMHTAALRSEVVRDRWRSVVRLGAHGVSALRSMGIRFGGETGKAPAAHLAPRSTDRGVTETPHSAHRPTTGDTHLAAARGDAALSRHDSTTSLTRGVTDHAEGPRPGVPSAIALGRTDSVATAAPRRVSFDEIAASISAQVDLNARDAAATIGWNVPRRNDVVQRVADPQEMHLRARAPIAASAVLRTQHESEYTRALESLRARDSRADSTRAERIVADRVAAQHAAIVATHARRQRETSSLEAEPGHRVAHSSFLRRALESTRRLVEDQTRFGDDRPEQTHTTRAVGASHTLSDLEDLVGREGVASSGINDAPPVPGEASRDLRDDGTLFASHAIPETGAVQPSVRGRIEESDDPGVAPIVRPGAMHTHRGPIASFEQQGTRR